MGTCIVSIFQYISNKMQLYTLYYIWKLLYMFRVLLPPIIRSVYNCIYSIWYLSHRYCYLPLSWRSWNWFECAVGGVHYPQHTQTVWQIPDAVDTVVCASDDGWWYHPKNVEQFPDIINCVKLHLVGYTCILKYICDAKTHEHQIGHLFREIRVHKRTHAHTHTHTHSTAILEAEFFSSLWGIQISLNDAIVIEDAHIPHKRDARSHTQLLSLWRDYIYRIILLPSLSMTWLQIFAFPLRRRLWNSNTM